MRIVLVNTNRMKPAIAPIGLDYIADSLTCAGHDARLIDLCFADDARAELERGIAEHQPEVVGVTIRNTDDCYMAGQDYFLPFIMDVIRWAKEAGTGLGIGTLREEKARGIRLPIIVGGIGYSIAPAETLRAVGADYGIAGDGEAGLVELIHALREGRDPLYLPGVAAMRGDKVVYRAPDLPDPSDLPYRWRTFVDNERYFREGGQAGIETKRGCAMECIYCPEPSAKGRKWRLRPPEMVVAEIEALYRQGIDHFHTCDSEFNLPLDHAIDVCRAIIKSGFGEKIRWYAYLAPEPFPEKLAELMRDAGCAGIDFGVDSCDDAQLKRLGRHFDSMDVAATVRTCKKYGIPFMMDLLIGGPGETQKSVRRTIEFAKSVDADCVGLSIGVRVYNGTRMAQIVRSMGSLRTNPELHGHKLDNDTLLKPIFYLSKDICESSNGSAVDAINYVRQLVDNDERFFLPIREEGDRNYNYNDNTVLIDAIRAGYRGAYWDILRRLKSSS